jgi:hypothetical protein
MQVDIHSLPLSPLSFCPEIRYNLISNPKTTLRSNELVKKIIALFLAILTITILLTGCAKTTAAPAYGALKVTVYGLDHQPLNGAKVVSDSQPGGQLKVTGLTDANGIVLFQNIKTGEYDFYISRFDYNQTQMDTTVRPGQTTEVPVYLESSNPGSTTTTTTASLITFSQLTSEPAKYNGQTVTIDGFWFDGFEIEVLAERLIPSSYAQGNLQPDGVKIWGYGGIPAEISRQLYLQPDNSTGYQAHYGKVELTGILAYGGGYGQMNSYQYQLTVQSAKLLAWSPN